MPFSTIYQRFVEGAPASVMVQSVLERVFAPQKIDRLFEKHAKRQYTRRLLFSAIVGLMSLVVLRLRKSVNAAYRPLSKTLSVSLTAVYDKLNCMEPEVSAGLVRDTAQEMATAIHDMKGALPPLVEGHRVIYLDGNCLAGSEHRIFELRDVRAAALPGKSLVMLDQETGLVWDIVPCEDGHAQERSLLDRVLEKLEERQVWVADRNFCTARFLASLHQRGVHFVIRRHGNLPCRTVGRRYRMVPRKQWPAVYEEEAVIWNVEDTPIQVRLITVVRKAPTRDGEHEIAILTNLSCRQANAEKVAAIYASRWGLETAFQKLTDVLRCEVDTLGYPKAALFAFSVAVTSYNVVATLEAGLRAVHGGEKIKTTLSTYHLTAEIAVTHGGMMRVVPVQDWQRIRRMTRAEFARLLLGLARRIDLDQMRKATRGPKHPVTPKTRYRNTPHVSTKKLLEQSRGTRVRTP